MVCIFVLAGQYFLGGPNQRQQSGMQSFHPQSFAPGSQSPGFNNSPQQINTGNVRQLPNFTPRIDQPRPSAPQNPVSFNPNYNPPRQTSNLPNFQQNNPFNSGFQIPDRYPWRPIPFNSATQSPGPVHNNPQQPNLFNQFARGPGPMLNNQWQANPLNRDAQGPMINYPQQHNLFNRGAQVPVNGPQPPIPFNSNVQGPTNILTNPRPADSFFTNSQNTSPLSHPPISPLPPPAGILDPNTLRLIEEAINADFRGPQQGNPSYTSPQKPIPTSPSSPQANSYPQSTPQQLYKNSAGSQQSNPGSAIPQRTPSNSAVPQPTNTDSTVSQQPTPDSVVPQKPASVVPQTPASVVPQTPASDSVDPQKPASVVPQTPASDSVVPQKPTSVSVVTQPADSKSTVSPQPASDSTVPQQTMPQQSASDSTVPQQTMPQQSASDSIAPQKTDTDSEDVQPITSASKTSSSVTNSPQNSDLVTTIPLQPVHVSHNRNSTTQYIPNSGNKNNSQTFRDPLRGMRIVCLFNNRHFYRNGFTPAKLQPHLCTHLNYEFAVLDPATHEMIVGEPDLDLDMNFYGVKYFSFFKYFPDVSDIDFLK